MTLARKAGLVAKRSRRASLSKVLARSVVIARGSAKASGAGVVKVKLVPTKAAKRAARKLGKATLTITVSQGSAVKKLTLKLR
jgi:hypothetical protein